jgi:hypothetical protein
MLFDRRQILLASAGGILAGCSTLPSSIMPGSNPSSGFSIADLSRRTFDWFWDLADPKTGLVPDRWPTPSFASIAAVGFGLTTYPYGVEKGWIARSAARERTLNTLRFFEGAPMGDAKTGVSGHRGFFYHFLKMEDGTRFGTTELSSIDTALLLGGILFAAEYFDADHPQEADIRTLAGRINGRVEWDWMLGKGPFVSMGWHPESGFIVHQWDRYNEAMLLYILAFGSPTHAIDPAIWNRYTAKFDLSWGTHWGEEHLHFPPLFGHQYSHVWIDFRGIQDAYMRRRGIDYFENSRRATRAQRNYAIANLGDWAGYSGDIWGLTACDGPGDFKQVVRGKAREFFSYSARGPGDRDDGTIAPTAAGGSIAFEPAITEAALAKMHAQYGSVIYGQYGFLDSFNPTLTDPAGLKLLHGKIVPGLCWVDSDYLGIDQGPIITMIANAQDDFVWRHMRKSPVIRDGLRKAGFSGGWLG